MERLNKRFEEKKTDIRFTQKNMLLLSRLDNVSFYISFLGNIDELKDWYQMAIDAGLNFEKKPIRL